MKPLYTKSATLLAVALTATAACTAAETKTTAAITEVRVWGEKRSSREASYTNPTSILTREDLASINVATTEDMVKYEPSLVIRRRFIGDSNGTLGLRGSNMFQTSRAMVFADGVPLHYFLESRWNGAPRWTLVSASEIAQVEVIYGPFSAEYSGNAMGGVVVMETAIPQKREFHADGALFTQHFDEYGFDGNLDGYRGFMSYGDKIGDLSVYLSWNRLENESQPQSFYYGAPASAASPQVVNGAIPGADELGNARLYFGDTGVIDTATDNFKFKAGYELGDWFALLNVAYEDRNSLSDAPNSYVRDSSGNGVWGGTVVQDGRVISIPASRLSVLEQDRDSLSVGLRLKGELSDSVALEANVSSFAILGDETRTSAMNPGHPAYTTAGQVLDYGDTGWRTADVKLSFDNLGIQGLGLVTGLRYEAYELDTNLYASSDYASGAKTRLISDSGGKTDIAAAFAQMNLDINQFWNLSLGGRFESWESNDGYYSQDVAATPELDTVAVPGRSKNSFSPKFSLGFLPDENWIFRYSAARAYRFPIVEELFSQYQAYNAISEANPALQPEDGIHHNLMIERAIPRGYVRLNLFRENIEDVIESQATILPGGASIRTFIPIDEVETNGVEFIANAGDFLVNRLDMRFNLAWIDAEIVDNAADPSIVGNTQPRMPEWRGNLLATYHLTERWNIGGSLQYASDSHGRLDNADGEDNVFNAQDAYTRIGLKTSYRYSEAVEVSLGMDNITNGIAYVAHPWPGRTLYLNLSYDM